MGREGFKEYICRPFCAFFHEGAKEGMACRGAQVAGLLIERKRLDTKGFLSYEKDPGLWKREDTLLETHVCRRCPFYCDGCDFRSLDPPPGSKPCGGYILLCLLEDAGLIGPADIEEVAGEG